MDIEFNDKEEQLRIFTMDNIELNEYLQNEYLENPMLECLHPQDRTIDLTEFSKEYEKHLSSIDYKKSTFAVQNGEQIKHYLLSQLNQNSYNKKEWNLYSFLIDCLDDNGFFHVSIEEISDLTHMPNDLIKSCLENLRILEPYGIFAKDLEHCLLRQLEVLGIEDEKLKKMILFYLSDIAEGKISNISRALKISTAQVRKYIAIISKLNPRPLTEFTLEEKKYIIPDIILNYDKEKWDISLNNQCVGNYKLNEYYIKLMENIQDKELEKYFQQKLERVSFIMNSIKQREKMVIQIFQVILKKQEDFFLGKGSVKIMTTLDIAKETEIQDFIIDKMIAKKYLQYPYGTIKVQALFSS